MICWYFISSQNIAYSIRRSQITYIVHQGDALYATEPMMELCRTNGWKYIFTQKETRQKLVTESYEWIAQGRKNRLYRIEHINSRNSNAMKNHYLLTQVADIIMQLYLAWNPFMKEIKQSMMVYSKEIIGEM